MIRLVKWIGIVIGGIVVLVVLAAIILPSIVNLDRYRTLLAGRVSKALGREVTVGSLQVNLWGGIGAEVKGIQIAQAQGFGSEPFIAAEDLRVRLQLLPLLRGQIKVTTAILDKPQIRLMRTADGHWSIDDLLRPHPVASGPRSSAEIPRAAKTPLLGGLLLNRVTVNDGQIVLVDRTRSGATLTLTSLDLTLRQATFSDALQIRLEGQIGSPGAGQLETTGRVSFADSEVPVLDLSIVLRNVEPADWLAFLQMGGRAKASGPLSADLKITGPVPRAGFSGSVDLRTVEFQMGEAFRKAKGEEADIRFEGRREGAGVNLTKLTVNLKDQRLDGTAQIPDLGAPRVTFAATSPKIDLDRLLGKSAGKSAWLAPTAAQAAETPRPPVSASQSTGGSALAAQGRLSVGSLLYQGLTLSGFQMDLRYQDGLVQVSDVHADVANGTLSAKGEMDLRPKLPRITLTPKLEGLATQPLVRAFSRGSWSLESTLSGDGSMSFVGLTKPDILGSAAGTGFILLKDGRLSDYKPLDRLAEVVVPLLASQGIKVRLDDFQQLSGHYTLGNGVLRTKDLTLTKPEGVVTAVGMLDLLGSTLDFDVTAKLGRSTVEAKVTGTTSKPIVVPKLAKFQQKIETEIDKALPGGQGKNLKELFKGLFGK